MPTCSTSVSKWAYRRGGEGRVNELALSTWLPEKAKGGAVSRRGAVWVGAGRLSLSTHSLKLLEAASLVVVVGDAKVSEAELLGGLKVVVSEPRLSFVSHFVLPGHL